ncbi:rhomboid family intramembrane serine protease [Prosthecobacter sp.]|uniref:rhomboid family intramembrane serine protease n=1 Tax=Prosthecobacter sp. TaxID=1965333 RepID=UPI001D607AB2|nr:rhomboid family intramembrane serine protease [Prosthecobacter sp.]MCB1277465.1 rhomboid family intramembrane serine protease [Prosthecobacter sp.]
MLNSWLPESKDHLPLTWWKQQPIYLAAIIALAGAASMIVTALLGYEVMGHFVFTFDSAFRQWHLWTPLTYVLVNPPSLWILLGCYLLWNFGEAVERHLGRRAFVRLLLLLLLVSPLLITLFGLVGIHGFACAGITQLEFGVFIAFATLYPRAKICIIILTLDAWVLAAILVGVNALGSLAGRDWASLFLLAANVGTAYAFIRFEKGELKLPRLPKVVFTTSSKTRPTKPAASKTPSVDDILDKISHHGMQSLTADERRILDKASDEMKRRAG